MALVLCALYQVCGATDKGFLGCVSYDAVCLATLATRGIVDHVAQVLFHSKRLASDGRLIDGDKWTTAVSKLRRLVLAITFFAIGVTTFDFGSLAVLVLLIFVSLSLVRFFAAVEFVFSSETLVYFKVFWSGVVAEETRISSYGATFLDDELVNLLDMVLSERGEVCLQYLQALAHEPGSPVHCCPSQLCIA